MTRGNLLLLLSVLVHMRHAHKLGRKYCVCFWASGSQHRKQRVIKRVRKALLLPAWPPRGCGVSPVETSEFIITKSDLG